MFGWSLYRMYRMHILVYVVTFHLCALNGYRQNQSGHAQTLLHTRAGRHGFADRWPPLAREKKLCAKIWVKSLNGLLIWQQPLCGVDVTSFCVCVFVLIIYANTIYTVTTTKTKPNRFRICRYIYSQYSSLLCIFEHQLPLSLSLKEQLDDADFLFRVIGDC